MNCFNEEQLNRISHLVREIEKLSDVEKLFLYLQLPCGRTETSEIAEGKSKFAAGAKPNADLFAKKPDQETTQTYTWILSHLEVDPNVSLPKQEVYDEYRAFCQTNKFEPLCVADFGKAMKHAFPCIKPRRLGQRGNSRYCYSGLRKKYKIQPPNLPDMIEPTFCMDNDCSQAYNQIIKDCRDNPEECPLNKPVFTGNEVMNLKIEPNGQHHHHQYPLKTNNNNANGNSSGCGTSAAAGANFNIDQANKQSTSSIHHHQSQQQATITGRQSHQTTHNMSTAISIHPLTPISHGHEYIPSNPIPIGQTSVRCSGYGGVIQQPGTPDDDDYQHNYQDIPSTNRHLFSLANASISHHQHHHQQQQTPATSGFSQQLQSHPSSIKTDNGRLMDTNDQNGNNHSYSGDLIGGETAPSSTLSMAHACPQMQQFSHLNSSLIDSCASPFQSPASTPYPQMGTYMGSDIQDYYSTNDCIRYTS